MRRCCLPPYVSRPRGCARLSHSEAAALCLGRPATRGFNPPRQCKSRAALTNASDGCARERGRGPRWRSWVRDRGSEARCRTRSQLAAIAGDHGFLCRLIGRLEFVSEFVSEFATRNEPRELLRSAAERTAAVRASLPAAPRPPRHVSRAADLARPPCSAGVCLRGRLAGAGVALSAREALSPTWSAGPAQSSGVALRARPPPPPPRPSCGARRPSRPRRPAPP